MELYDFKQTARQVKAPAPDGTMGGAPPPSAGDLIERLRQTEMSEAKRLRQARLLYGLAAGLCGIGVVAAVAGSIGAPIGGRFLHQVVLVGTFALLALLAGRRVTGLARLDYGQDVRAFLAEAEERYAFMRRRDWAAVAAGVLLLGLSGAAYVRDYILVRFLPDVSPMAGTAVYAAGYLLLCLMGLYFTWGNWKRDRKALLMEIRQVRAALGAADPG